MKILACAFALSTIFLGQAAVAASPFDGVYSGATTWAGNGNRRCTGVPDFKITVREGQFNYGGGGDRIPVTVAADGKFSAQSGQRYLEGRITGNQLTATTSGGACNYIWDLRK